MNNNIEKINNAKELIDKAIIDYKKALDKLSKNETDEVKKIKREIEEQIDKLKKTRIKLENVNEQINANIINQKKYEGRE